MKAGPPLRSHNEGGLDRVSLARASRLFASVEACLACIAETKADE